MGLKSALVSASRNAADVLSRLGLTNLFDVVATSGDVPRQKPAPELFLLAAEKLKVFPGQCLVIEDAESGIRRRASRGNGLCGAGAKRACGPCRFTLAQPRRSKTGRSV